MPFSCKRSTPSSILRVGCGSTSAWAPKHYPRNVLEFANKRGRDKVLYAGYLPGLSYDRIFGEMDELPLRDETWPAFLRDNAVAVYCGSGYRSSVAASLLRRPPLAA